MKKQTYRIEDGQYKELQKKLIDNDMSFQGFVDMCVDKYLAGSYNPKEEKMIRLECKSGEVEEVQQHLEEGIVLFHNSWDYIKDAAIEYGTTELQLEENQVYIQEFNIYDDELVDYDHRRVINVDGKDYIYVNWGEDENSYMELSELEAGTFYGVYAESNRKMYGAWTIGPAFQSKEEAKEWAIDNNYDIID